MSQFLLDKYRANVHELLEKHHLAVPQETADMLAKTLMRHQSSRYGKSRTPTALLKKAVNHVEKVSTYLESPPTRKTSLKKRTASLVSALNSLSVATHLAVSKPSVDVPRLITRLETGDVTAVEVDELRMSLRHLLSMRTHSGRPRGSAAHIVRGGVITWLRAGKQPQYTYAEITNSLSGPLPSFLIDLMKMCGFSLKDATLKTAMLTALRECKNT